MRVFSIIAVEVMAVARFCCAQECGWWAPLGG
jgi:hypothetical protein